MVQVLTRSKDLVGKKLCTKDGSEIGTVSDVVVDQHNKKLLALLVGSGNADNAKAIKYEDIHEIIEDVIFVDKKKEEIKKAKEIFEIETENTFRQTEIIDGQGNKQGVLVDFYFNPKSAKIKALEIQGDDLNGNKRIDIDQIEELSNDKIRLKDNTDLGGGDLSSGHSSIYKGTDNKNVADKLRDKIKQAL